jgi:outer membrane protein OmpA-like peptidoglycan-associated protein
MKNILVISVSLLIYHMGLTQGFILTPLSDINTVADDIACTRFENTMVYLSGTENDLVNDYQWNRPPSLGLYSAQHGTTFSQWKGREKFLKHGRNDIGPASYAVADSTIYFSSSENFSTARGDRLKLYQMKWDGASWGKPQMLSFCTGYADFTHPWYDAASKLLVYSSNCAGGYGGMDIWYVYKLDSGWGEPVNAGIMVNTSSHEIFPSFDAGDIIYSSNQPGGRGGYDLRKAHGDQQWKAITSLDEPFNGEGDDISLLRFTEDKWILTSARKGGKGGDDLYVVERSIPKDEFNTYAAELSYGGQPQNGTELKISNEYGELVSQQVCDSLGRLDLSMLRFGRGYRIQLGGIDPSLYSECIIILRDEKGNKLRELRFNMSGFADLELLPLSFTELNLLPLEDESVLRINIEGQLYDERPGDVGRDEPVTILDEEGIPLAIAYTNEAGRFRFTKVEPQAEYTFQLSKETAASNVLIMDKGEKITLPVLDAEINYMRVNQEDAIELIDEYNQKIVVSPKDLFVINRIYYDYNSSNLTSEASSQLDQIAMVMQKNPKILVEFRSHTDSRGEALYNKSLSGKRAKAAVTYLIKKGLSISRFKAEGIGEEELLNECADGVECSDPEHSINRRTEIRLSRMTDVR